MIGDPGNLAGDQQAATRLRVGEQQAFALVAGRATAPPDMRRDPLEVAAGATAHVPGVERVACAVEVGHGVGIDHGGEVARARQLVQVTEKTEPGDVGGAARARRERRLGGTRG